MCNASVLNGLLCSRPSRFNRYFGGHTRKRPLLDGNKLAGQFNGRGRNTKGTTKDTPYFLATHPENAADY